MVSYGIKPRYGDVSVSWTQPSMIWPPTEGDKVRVRDNAADPNFHNIFSGRDDEDYFTKTWLMTQYAAYISSFIWLHDVIIHDRRGIQMLQRAGVWGVPFIGGGIAYTTAVCVAANLRNKNDLANHAIGGAAFGSVVSATTKWRAKGFSIGLLVAFFGMSYKWTKLHGYDLFPYQGVGERGWSWGHKMDYTMKQDYPGYWVRSEREAAGVVNR